MMYLLVLVIVAAAIGYYIWYSKNTWKTVEVATGAQTEEVQMKYALLQNEGVRCRVKTDENPANMAMAGGPLPETGGVSPSNRATLQVHAADLDRARDILDRNDTVV
ncbi:DUF2007 domain-containing protein [Paenibacillus aurantius]|uniref:DUF2007 domain-containing protein n=1 Tax=Paenibacillus aurantius TaxID=2918900 RepID=A0AA96LB48_9BACL|nr:DUF2007 domain-containing protein [Paenibacillus aurantius]WNQ10599.1 DUF2007 domain-containing protein [Paenibacillus aurantius]